MNIAVDAMGGDHGPEVIVRGAVEAAMESGLSVTLVGDGEAVNRAFRAHEENQRVTVCHCDQAVGMDEPPLKALRSKPQASIRVAFDLVKRGLADAVVSAGNSGATFAAGLLLLGKVKGVERPALASIFPGRRGEVLLLDVGANVDCRPVHLLQFGVMGQAFAAACLDIEDPKVGLLSIGEEGGKGNEQVRKAYELFKVGGLNFVGNVEGRDLFSGEVPVVVCDGFVGNVALKVSEGMSDAVASMLRQELGRTAAGRLAMILGRPAMERLRKTLDYETYGGAPILGINGVGLVCHGSSSARAIKNAVIRAAEYAGNNFQDKLSRRMSELASGGETVQMEGAQ